jgi:Protein of unknown function (DUF1177)
MSLKHALEVMDAVDSPSASGADIREVFARLGWDGVSTEMVEGTGGSTDFVKAVVPGSEGKASGGDAPTLGVVGRLGGLGAWPEAIAATSPTATGPWRL